MCLDSILYRNFDENDLFHDIFNRNLDENYLFDDIFYGNFDVLYDLFLLNPFFYDINWHFYDFPLNYNITIKVIHVQILLFWTIFTCCYILLTDCLGFKVIRSLSIYCFYPFLRARLIDWLTLNAFAHCLYSHLSL
jgi:hypothetical protein